MLRFWRSEPTCKLTANQRQIARRILLGFEGEFPRENDHENIPGITVQTDAISGPKDPLKRSDEMGLVLLENLPINRVTTFPCAHCLRTVITIRYGSQTELVFDARPSAIGDDIALKAHTCTDDATDGGGL